MHIAKKQILEGKIKEIVERNTQVSLYNLLNRMPTDDFSMDEEGVPLSECIITSDNVLDVVEELIHNQELILDNGILMLSAENDKLRRIKQLEKKYDVNK